MKAYIDIVDSGHLNKVSVVSQQDYEDGGPHAHSYKTKAYPLLETALKDARDFMSKYGYEEVAGPECF